MKIRILILLLLLSACGGGSSATVETDTPGTVDSAVQDATVDTAPLPDTAVDTAPDTMADSLPDTAVDTVPACEPGTGCFLEPCESAADCLSGICLEHLGDKVCSMECVEDCPEGWDCQQISSGPDLTLACVSPFSHLCRPCHDNQDCQSPSGLEAVCLDYGDVGRFCGADCSDSGLCPSGYICKAAVTVAGGAVTQCVPDAGVCACSKTAIQMGLTTPCFVENDLGTCDGIRTCGEDGLSPCDAAEPAEEVCNGLDDNCDGQTDELGCDDENPCTDDTCDPDQGCVYTPLTGTDCNDGDVCSLADHCQDGECVGTAINCDDGNPCTDDLCDPAGGCLYAFNDADCDDGDPSARSMTSAPRAPAMASGCPATASRTLTAQRWRTGTCATAPCTATRPPCPSPAW